MQLTNKMPLYSPVVTETEAKLPRFYSQTVRIRTNLLTLAVPGSLAVISLALLIFGFGVANILKHLQPLQRLRGN